MASLGNRIVVLIDMDCFFCQVEARLRPEFTGKPMAVVQYNQWKSGAIIAVNYEARDFGVTRHMRGDEAKEKCPDILLATVPCLRGKADTSRYRSAGREVIQVLNKNCSIVERASVDEAYLDITQIVDDKLSKAEVEYEDLTKQLKNTFIVGYSETGVNDEEQRKEGLKTWLSEISEDVQIQRLAVAGSFVEKLREEVFETTGFRCSAGISFNKILAKLACGLHKPNRQTILPASSVPDLFGMLPVKKVRNLGGKLGEIVIDSLKCNVMADLLPHSLQYLQDRFDEKTGMWLYNIARGVDTEPVTPRLVPKSLGACKQFRGKLALVEAEKIKHWLSELAAEVCERLEQDLDENQRKASLLTVSFQYYQDKKAVTQSRSCAITSYKPERVASQSFDIVVKATHQLPIAFLGLSASKFVKVGGSANFRNFFTTTPTVEKAFDATNNADEDVSIGDSKQENLEEFEHSTDEECESTISHELVDETKLTESNINLQLENEISQKSSPNLSKVDRRSSPNVSKVNRRSSPCSSIQSSLKTDNFKKSFFMNILKEKQSVAKDSNEDTEIRSEEHCSETIADLCNDDNSIKNTTVCAKSNESRDLNPTWSDDNQQKVTIELQEIFPDLNDIDPDIVRLLPSHLQEEVKKLWRMSETQRVKDSKIAKEKREEAITRVPCKEVSKDTVANKTIVTKGCSKNGSKGKSSKSKPIKSNIGNFFIKTDVNQLDQENNNYKKCPQCGQMILIHKFEEHNDYHVAQAIQTEMNRMSSASDDTRKRKVSLDSPMQSKKRLSGELVSKT